MKTRQISGRLSGFPDHAGDKASGYWAKRDTPSKGFEIQSHLAQLVGSEHVRARAFYNPWTGGFFPRAGTENKFRRDIWEMSMISDTLEEVLTRFRDTHPYQHVELQGVPWDYIAGGQGSQALLILGGGLSTGESSFRTILRLENRFRVISPSYPPVGRLAPVMEGLAAILEREGFHQAHVFGHSLGSAIGHAFVRRHPQQVDRLVLDGFGLYTAGHTRAAKLFFKLPFPLLRAYYRRALNHYVALSAEEERDFYQAYFDDLIYNQFDRQSMMGQFKLLIDLFNHPVEYQVFQPVERPGKVLLILADDDRGFNPAEREAFKASYPGAQLYRFTSGGHLSGFTHPEEFNAVLDGFLMGEKSLTVEGIENREW